MGFALEPARPQYSPFEDYFICMIPRLKDLRIPPSMPDVFALVPSNTDDVGYYYWYY